MEANKGELRQTTGKIKISDKVYYSFYLSFDSFVLVKGYLAIVTLSPF